MKVKVASRVKLHNSLVQRLNQVGEKLNKTPLKSETASHTVESVLAAAAAISPKSPQQQLTFFNTNFYIQGTSP